MKSTTFSAPGRICLFGEHQDYLRLPVIAMAIDRRVYVTGGLRDDDQICINLPDTNSRELISPARPIKYEKPRDYLRSAVNVLERELGIKTHGLDATISGNIPMNSGTSSSTAMIIAW